MGMPKADRGLGFREVDAFNKALLAKQCWRVVRNVRSMAVVILKNKYFRNSEIL